MRFLRVLGLDLIFARRARHIFVAEFAADHAARGGDGLGGDIDAVGTHISDEADGLAADIDAFIELLRHPHRDFRRHAELSRGFLLQRRGRERGVGMALGGLGLHRNHGEVRVFQIALERLGLGAGADVETRDLLAVGADEAGGEGRVGLVAQMGDQRPIFAGDEFFDFQLAVADQPQGDRLHASGGFGARQLAPQHRRKVESDQIIQGAAGEIGLDQALVDLARVLHRLQDRVLGDGVEDDALDRLVLEHAFCAQNLQHVPGNGLSLAVRVGRQDDAVGVLDEGCDVRRGACPPCRPLPTAS